MPSPFRALESLRSLGSPSKREPTNLERAGRYGWRHFLSGDLRNLALDVGGGLFGLALSWPTSRLISDFVRLLFVFDSKSAVLAVAAAATLNFAFSLLPSRKAASISPIEALRLE